MKSPFRPQLVQPRSAPDEIAAQVRNALIEGIIRPGDRLGSEGELAQEFGVSRATVREAIKVLRTHGILRTARGARGGHFVVSPQTEAVAESVGETFGLWLDAGSISIAEVDEARLVIERACVRFAATRRSDEDLRLMREILTRSRDRRLSLASFLECDVRFHRQIAVAAGNRLLELPMTAIHLVRPRTNILLRHHDRARVAAQHEAILDAVAARDPDGAEAAFLSHIEHLNRERQAALAATRRAASEIQLRELELPADPTSPPLGADGKTTGM